MDTTDQPPLPTAFLIPNALVQKWAALSGDAVIEATFTANDLNHLFFAIDCSLNATKQLQASLIAYTNGNVADANRLSWDSSRLMIEGSNNLRQFMAAVMATAEVAS